MKTCRVCKETKPLDEFHRASNTPDGRQYRCKPCAIAAARQRALDNPERHREIDRRYRQTEKYRQTRARLREANRDKINAQKRASYYRNHEANLDKMLDRRDDDARAKARERHERWRKSDPRGAHRQSIWTAYKLTLDEFDAMIRAQEGRCVICSEPMQIVNVDHCHTGGNVRALLCHLCNRGLGLFRENPDYLAAAITYLRAHAPG